MDVRAHEKYHQGLSYFQDDRYQEAIESFKQAIQLEPDSGEAHYNLGLAYQRLGSLDKAILLFVWGTDECQRPLLPHLWPGRSVGALRSLAQPRGRKDRTCFHLWIIC